MKNSNIILATIAIIVLIFGLLIIFYKDKVELEDLKGESPENIEYPEETPNIVTPTQTPKQGNFEDLLKAESKLKDEADKENKSYLEAYNKAFETSDTKLCELIKNEELKNKCLDNINLNIATSKLNITLCNKIIFEDYKTKCLNEIYYKNAIANNNLETCKLIKNELLKEDCISKLNIEKISVEEVEKEKEDNELKQKATISLNTSECNKIEDDTKKSSCISTITYKTSIINLDENLCGKINNTKLSSKCREIVSKKMDDEHYKTAINNKSIQTCEKISENSKLEECKNRVYINSAIEKNDVNICKLISDISLESACRIKLSN